MKKIKLVILIIFFSGNVYSSYSFHVYWYLSEGLLVLSGYSEEGNKFEDVFRFYPGAGINGLGIFTIEADLAVDMYFKSKQPISADILCFINEEFVSFHSESRRHFIFNDKSQFKGLDGVKPLHVTYSPGEPFSLDKIPHDFKPVKSKKRIRKQTKEQRKAANVRERSRMFEINKGFENLSQFVPVEPYEKGKKLSRIEIVTHAIKYIEFLLNMEEKSGDGIEARWLNMKLQMNACGTQ